MIRIGIVGDIASGKTFVANNFGYQVLMLTMKYQNYIEKIKKFISN